MSMHALWILPFGVKVKSNAKERVSDEACQYTSVPFCDEAYRGQALVIVNGDFEDAALNREGTHTDSMKMKELFECLGFRVKVYNNLKAAKMLEKIKKAALKKKRNKQCDCFVLVVSTHGREIPYSPKEQTSKGYSTEATVWRHELIGSDGLPLDVDAVMELLKDTDKNINGLRNKPKLVFLQACRYGHDKDDGFDHGTSVPVSTGSSNQPTPRIKCRQRIDNIGSLALENPGKSSVPTRGDKTANCKVDNRRDPNFKPPFKSSYVTGLYSDWTDDEDSDEVDIEELYNSDVVDIEELYNSDEVDIVDADVKKTSVYVDEGCTGLSLPLVTESMEGVHLSPVDTGSTSNRLDAGHTIRPNKEEQPMPMRPFDVVPIACPADCLVMYPVSAHKAAVRELDLGSYMLHYMNAKSISASLISGEIGLLEYLTRVAAKMAETKIDFRKGCRDFTKVPEDRIVEFLKYAKQEEYSDLMMTEKQMQSVKTLDPTELYGNLPRNMWSVTQINNMPFKMSTHTVHRLVGNIRFTAKIKTVS